MSVPTPGWKIWHNPDCSTSRKVLAALRTAGIEPQVIEYLQTPPDRPTLRRLIRDAGLTPRALLRRKGPLPAELGLDDETLGDDVLVDRMLEHPVLIERPLVESPAGTRLCRPAEVVEELIRASRRR